MIIYEINIADVSWPISDILQMLVDLFLRYILKMLVDYFMTYILQMLVDLFLTYCRYYLTYFWHIADVSWPISEINIKDVSWLFYEINIADASWRISDILQILFGLFLRYILKMLTNVSNQLTTKEIKIN